jgi:hypothetical protein
MRSHSASTSPGAQLLTLAACLQQLYSALVLVVSTLLLLVASAPCVFTAAVATEGVTTVPCCTTGAAVPALTRATVHVYPATQRRATAANA